MRWLVCLGFCVSSLLVSAQTAVNITADPHYHLLLQNDETRVFSFILPPSEQVYLRYEHSFLLIPLNDGELAIWSEGASPISHFLFHTAEVHFWIGNHVGGMRNDRSTRFRAVVVEFLNPKVVSYAYDETGQRTYAGGGVSLPVDPHLRFINSLAMGAAAASEVQLLPGDSFPPPPKVADELLIAVSDVDLKGKGDTDIRRSSGQVAWLAAGRTWDLTNHSSTPARFTAVYFWKQPAN
jgi:hypothetical protein